MTIKPKWYEHTPWHPYKDGLFNGCKKILKNDNNIKPPHINQSTQNTEFWVKRNKKECTVVIGESWTYGESLNDRILAAHGKFDLETQLTHCWGTQVATLLDTDYYQYAVPGNNNFTMFNSVKRILSTVYPLYDTVYLLIQMTEPSREDVIVNELKGHPMSKLYNPEWLKGVSVKEWCVKNEAILLKQLENDIAKYNNLKTTVWKNFCKFQTNEDYSFKTLQETWMEFSARINGHKIESPDLYVAGWIDGFLKQHKMMKSKAKYLNQQLDLIEASNKFLEESNDHKPHPSASNHRLWAYNVFNLMKK